MTEPIRRNGMRYVATLPQGMLEEMHQHQPSNRASICCPYCGKENPNMSLDSQRLANNREVVAQQSSYANWVQYARAINERIRHQLILADTASPLPTTVAYLSEIEGWIQSDPYHQDDRTTQIEQKPPVFEVQ